MPWGEESSPSFAVQGWTGEQASGWNRVRASIVAIGAVVTMVATTVARAPAAIAGRTPQAVLQALRAHPLDVRHLPSTLTHPRSMPVTDTPHLKRHHALGGVAVYFNGDRDVVVYF